MTYKYTITEDPTGVLAAALPIDRAPYEALARAVLAMRGPGEIPAADWAQYALDLTDHAEDARAELQLRHSSLPKGSPVRAAVAATLREADRRLSVQPPRAGSLDHAQRCARLVQALHEGLDDVAAAASELPAHP